MKTLVFLVTRSNQSCVLLGEGIKAAERTRKKTGINCNLTLLSLLLSKACAASGVYPDFTFCVRILDWYNKSTGQITPQKNRSRRGVRY